MLVEGGGGVTTNTEQGELFSRPWTIAGDLGYAFRTCCWLLRLWQPTQNPGPLSMRTTQIAWTDGTQPKNWNSRVPPDGSNTLPSDKRCWQSSFCVFPLAEPVRPWLKGRPLKRQQNRTGALRSSAEALPLEARASDAQERGATEATSQGHGQRFAANVRFARARAGPRKAPLA